LLGGRRGSLIRNRDGVVGGWGGGLLLLL